MSGSIDVSEMQNTEYQTYKFMGNTIRQWLHILHMHRVSCENPISKIRYAWSTGQGRIVIILYISCYQLLARVRDAGQIVA